MNSRFLNFTRISHLPHDRFIRRFLLEQDPTTTNTVLGRYLRDKNHMDKAQSISSIDQESYEDCLRNYNKNSLKSMIKRINIEFDFMQNSTQIRGTHAESILEFFSPSTHHPLLNKCGKNFSTLISWMVASTDLACDKIHHTRHKISQHSAVFARILGPMNQDNIF